MHHFTFQGFHAITRLKCVIYLLLLFNQASAQQKFNPALLNDYKKNGAYIASLLNTKEVYEYHETSGDCIYLKNGFRSHRFINEERWLAIKDTVEVYRIDIVYSKYPLRNGIYEEIYPLLFRRIRSTIVMDPMLNDSEIEWNKVLQTHCLNDRQVNTLFHGVVIWYRTEHSEEKKITPTPAPPVAGEQSGKDEILRNIETLFQDEAFPDSLRKELEKLPVERQSEVVQTFLEKAIAAEPDIDLSKSTDEELEEYEETVNNYLNMYPYRQDSVVIEVLNRHPEWKNMLVVNDWTGSMYHYGAQVLQWHIKNHEHSGIYSLTLFNDGDYKSTEEKRPGETGGIYSEKADNIPKLIKLFRYVSLKGGGGDGPENDIEAILKAMEYYAHFTEIVLIADNNACVRDIELADRIGKPVKVIICGYQPKTGINPDYVYLAKLTGGGIYTIEDDLENINATLGKPGEITSLLDKRFKIKSKRCNEGWAARLNMPSYLKDSLYTDLNAAVKNRKKAKRLSLSEKGLDKIPSKTFRIKNLNYLNLAHNNLTRIPDKVSKLRYLKALDLSANKLTTVPKEFRALSFMDTLNLSANALTTIPDELNSLSFMRSLNLSHNQISSMSKAGVPPRLEHLNLSGNQFTGLPKLIGRMRKLKTLDLSHNQIEVLPESITNLTRLSELNISDNRLTKLPVNISKFKNLKKLNLRGNAFPEEEKTRIRSALPFTQITF